MPDYRTDLYSLGVVLFHLSTARLPFEHASVSELIHAIISTPSPAPHELNTALPTPLSDIIVRLLQKAPSQRYQSAYGLWRDLQECLDAYVHTQTVAPFTLQQHDKSIVFRFPSRLYGRLSEASKLDECYAQVCAHGGRRLALVGGRAGVGKSAIVAQAFSKVQQVNHFFLKHTLWIYLLLWIAIYYYLLQTLF